jgi:hypothetical protein
MDTERSEEGENQGEENFADLTSRICVGEKSSDI